MTEQVKGCLAFFKMHLNFLEKSYKMIFKRSCLTVIENEEKIQFSYILLFCTDCKKRVHVLCGWPFCKTVCNYLKCVSRERIC